MTRICQQEGGGKEYPLLTPFGKKNFKILIIIRKFLRIL